MNAELESAGMIGQLPTGSREDYLGTLRAASNDGHFAGMVSAFRHALRWTARMDFSSRETAEPLLEATTRSSTPSPRRARGSSLQLP